MQAVQTLQPTLASALWPSSTKTGALRAAVLMVLGTVALWLSSKIQVPLVPVPITMQTLVVLVIGVAYGWKLGGATVLLYLAEGAVGLPVFAGSWSEGGGIELLYGPTGGYLVGFAVAAAICGALAERGWDRSLVKAGAAMVIGNLIIYALGLTWLALQIGIADALKYGLLPFLFGDALKILLGACLLPGTWSLIGRRKS
ncbi:MAG TPA: biotin transporter BioY [Hypericibacter adhaerens]|jgi:biotin transport system substrate-specific component|uniref:Biotin transporter n=1 Tax=Hypericibacter adhaerens TaxID=2602016 RepID=A0A5J6MVK1_9PROT|nr:biotin transporter BioY [Hypericibacter adhaerens]QEX20755.1 biotin transporter BioY [Hypericibacter adhaerens]HWA45312.1 biotin transporter BioY [Hypericibacter adhaerens]